MASRKYANIKLLQDGILEQRCMFEDPVCTHSACGPETMASLMQETYAWLGFNSRAAQILVQG